jgi:hypothetical protein
MLRFVAPASGCALGQGQREVAIDDRRSAAYSSTSSMASTTNESARPSEAWFLTTHWSVVLSAREQPSAQSAAALEILCRTYWHPLYAYVRRQGHCPRRRPGPHPGVLRAAAAKGLSALRRPGEGQVPHLPAGDAQTGSRGRMGQGQGPEARRRPGLLR